MYNFKLFIIKKSIEKNNRVIIITIGVWFFLIVINFYRTKVRLFK